MSHGSCAETTSDGCSAAVDHAAFSAIYARHLTSALRWLRAQGVPEGDTEDVAQEVFAIVFHKLHQFDGEKPGAWIYAICKRAASDYRRRAWFRHALSRRHEFSVEHVANEGGSPATELEAKERYRLMWRILSNMRAKQRSVFVLFEVEGCTGAEIAALEGIPEKTVWSRLSRARKRFIELERQFRLPDHQRASA